MSGHRTTLTLLALGVFVGAILWLPASVLAAFFPKSMTCADLTGTVWRGQCSELSVRGSRSGSMIWQIHATTNRPAGLRVELLWQKSASIAHGTLTSPLSRAPSLRFGESVIDLQTLRNALPANLALGALAGVSGTLDTSNLLFEFQSGTLARLTGELVLRDARLLKSGAAIGPFLGQFSGAEGMIRDLGGALGLSATVNISAGTFRAKLRLEPRTANVLPGFGAGAPIEADVEGRF